MNHIGTCRSQSPRENYSLLIIGVSNGDEDGGGVDGDPSGGTSPFRQGAGTETSVPRNLVFTMTAATDFFLRIATIFGFFSPGGINRRSGGVKGGPGGPHLCQ